MAIDHSRLPAPPSRTIAPAVQAALAHSPVVLIQGPRHSGNLQSEPLTGLGALEGAAAQTDLAMQVGGADRHTIDMNLFVHQLAVSRGQAAQLWEGHGRVTILDAHRHPALMAPLALAAAHSAPGRFLLTASIDLAGAMFHAEYGQHRALAGMPMQTFTLLPPSQMELLGGSGWLDAVFEGRLASLATPHTLSGQALADRALAGGHLESIVRDRPRSRHAWHAKHLEALMASPPKRRIGAKEEKLLINFPPPPPSDFSSLRGFHALDKPQKALPLLQELARGAGQICNFRQWGSGLDLDSKTTERYTYGLQWMHLVQRLQSVGADHAGFPLQNHQRLVKTDRLHFVDSGVLGELLEQNTVNAARDAEARGSVWTPPMAQVLTSFVVAELMAQSVASASPGAYRLAHYRDHDQLDIDLVIANDRDEVVMVDVKAANRLGPPDTRAMAQLADKLGKQLKLAVILYDGADTQQVMKLDSGAPLWIAPVSSLWGQA